MSIEIPGFESLEEFLGQYWYYTCEVAPGVFSEGGDHLNILATRWLLSQFDPGDAEILDIGSMEAMVPILMARKGARVTAIDALDFSAKVNALKQIYGVKFEYFPRLALGDTVNFMRKKPVLSSFLEPKTKARGFDAIICSGVLYHVFNFFETLAMCRTLLRKGGYLFLETPTALRDDYSLIYNFTGKEWIFPNGTNTWFVTAPLLDHFLRFLRLKVIDWTHVTAKSGIPRLAVVAQAIDDMICSELERPWFLESSRNFDYAFFCDLEFAQGTASKKMIYNARQNHLKHPDMDAIDLFRSAVTFPGLPLDPDRTRLHLNDRD